MQNRELLPKKSIDHCSTTTLKNFENSKDLTFLGADPSPQILQTEIKGISKHVEYAQPPYHISQSLKKIKQATINFELSVDTKQE